MTPDEPSALDRLRRLEQEDAERRARPSRAEGSAPDGAHPSAKKRGVVAGLLASLLLLLAKGKALLVLLATKGGLLLSALNFGKIAATFATMGISFWFYVGFYPWTFALGLLVLILVHELGHGVAAMRLGLKVGAPIFIPGFGAVIALKDQPRSTWMNAVVGYGGPLAGTLGGVAVLAFGPLLSPASGGFWNALAHFTFLINLFNLLPVGGLDGDRITEPVTVPHWITGLAVTAVVTVLSLSGHRPDHEGTDPQVLFALAILILGAVKAFRVYRRAARAAGGDQGRLVDRVVGRGAAYTEEAGVTPKQRRAAAIAYFGLVALLAGLSSASALPPR